MLIHHVGRERISPLAEGSAKLMSQTYPVSDEGLTALLRRDSLAAAVASVGLLGLVVILRLMVYEPGS